MVIHCSAGIGRTGTLVLLDVCVQVLKDKKRIPDLTFLLDRVRSQRLHAVQSDSQFLFIHVALIEYCFAKGLLTPRTSTETNSSGTTATSSDLAHHLLVLLVLLITFH